MLAHVSLYSNDTCNCTCTSSVCYYWPVCSSNPRLKAAFCRFSAAVYLPIKCFVFCFPKRRRKCSDPTCSSFCFCHQSSLNLDTLYIRYVCVWGWIYTTSTLVFLEQYKPPCIFIKAWRNKTHETKSLSNPAISWSLLVCVLHLQMQYLQIIQKQQEA